MKKSFTQKITPPKQLDEPALWFIFKDEEILLHISNDLAQIPQYINPDIFKVDISHTHYLGIYGETHCFTVELSENHPLLPADLSFLNLRKSYEAVNDEDLFLIASRAKQILMWDRSTQFCSYCGAKTAASATERAKICPQCKAMTFPQIAPVVLALISRGDELLLARSPHFVPGLYSILAGFVEPGETIEQTVAREVQEEVSIQIKNIQYYGSQPWPFPSNLMIGFTAEYASGEIKIDPIEIEDAQWFNINNLPLLPAPMSLSRRMIDAYLAQKLV